MEHGCQPAEAKAERKTKIPWPEDDEEVAGEAGEVGVAVEAAVGASAAGRPQHK